MNKNLTAAKSILIQSTPEKVWEVLTDPEKIKVYLFGTETITDWAVGSPIVFQGAYNGQTYKDKGNVLQNKAPQLLQYNYWSGFSGLADHPDHYSLVTYTIEPAADDQVQFTWTQQGFATEEGQAHTEKGLAAMLEQIKTLAEE